jgi:DNA-directed RNA polymerase alpha subunit
MKSKKEKRTCPNGHSYFKSSDCPTCPLCEQEKMPVADFHGNLSAPARRALENANIFSLVELSKWSEKELLNLHGLGPSSIPKLKKALAEKGLDFKN